ncbi:hypothetical protein LX15_004201 [Streptoalloteichus tenebrarius]|uniref:Primosomal protein n=1 Tax=Streptoalloteichus tenebrarius (strain ATCC 17920 / DSM 40477 / JCM 4838 / CBS 697.72 / NBRC 16177 / NCIMB 11028 / NRRL B-12390 / A12253. 1 / ISP 5477) TaxID=1933 RepID=A0ABT1HY99_STRSD|nr:primosomal protein [Streptoalloteichus tenebrarius]MCP2260483.1 hypothetical protein [Streptoalloteichus tenebrarius]BFF02721.1 hypothetical protein GCM10020241_43960 [Streptoalloteichus tenebrarius]
MAQDIVPIELSLTEGDVVTLWAPRWREEGEEWEAFLGDEDALFAFPDAAHLAAFVRTADRHDLSDHPAWHVVPQLSVDELIPDEEHRFDVVGVLELVAEEPDTWVVSELAGIVSMVRSLADVCDLEKVHEVLDSAEGFALLERGTLPFTGRDGEKVWTELARVVAERWDEVLDALDEVVTEPVVDADALAAAEDELAEIEAAEDESDEDFRDGADDTDADRVALTRVDEEELAGAGAEADAEEEPTFWAEVGIDPIRIITSQGEFYTLRCYLDDEPVFLGAKGRVDVFASPRALARYLAEEDVEHDLLGVATWDEVAARATAGELEIEVDPENTYVLQGLAEDLAEGPDAVDPTQLDLAVELLADAAQWADDDSVERALAPSERLGWLVSFVLRPDPTRMAPSAPYDAEVAAWRELVAAFEDRLVTH